MSDLDHIREALLYAKTNSHDETTQVGAVIVAGRRLVYGANRIAAPVAAGKYAITEHAEREAIYKAAACGVPLAGATMYAPWFACTDCARGIILSGIREVVGLASLRQATPARWLENIRLADQMFLMAGVGVRWIADAAGVTIRFDERDFSC
jgi:dCMP deaminase